MDVTRHGTTDRTDRTVEELVAELGDITEQLRRAPTLVEGRRPGTRTINPEVLSLLARERRLVRALRAARARRRRLRRVDDLGRW